MYETEYLISELNYLKDSLLLKLSYDIENSKASPDSKKLAEEYRINIGSSPPSFLCPHFVGVFIIHATRPFVNSFL